MMSKVRYSAMRAGLGAMHAARLHRLSGDWARGIGVILTFHHVRPPCPAEFQPSAILEITPGFFDALIGHLRAERYEIVPMDEVPARIRQGWGGPRFAALTFDDGYRDNLEYALPILRRHAAPATIYATRGFAEHTASMWWRDLEAIIRRERHLLCRVGGVSYDLPIETVSEKYRAYLDLYWQLRDLGELDLRRAMEDLRTSYPVDSLGGVDRLCLSWRELAELAGDPLITIGAHTLTHPKLAACTVDEARSEIDGGRLAIAEHLGFEARHLAYPFGDVTSAGPREFALARDLRFATAVTTRPGLLFPDHADHLLALPRLSVNGNFQRIPDMTMLLSGLPFASMYFGRRINVA